MEPGRLTAVAPRGGEFGWRWPACSSVAVHVLLPVALALGIYACMRPATGAIFEVGSTAGAVLRFVAYAGPDAAWAYAFTASLGLIWSDGARSRRTWLLAALVVALGLEFAQAGRFLPGTFDPLDVVAIVAAWVVAVLGTRPKRRSLS